MDSICYANEAFALPLLFPELYSTLTENEETMLPLALNPLLSQGIGGVVVGETISLLSTTQIVRKVHYGNHENRAGCPVMSMRPTYIFLK